MTPHLKIALTLLVLLQPLTATAQSVPVPAQLTADAINGAQLGLDVGLQTRLFIETKPEIVGGTETAPILPSASVARLQILLDQHGISPGVIDGFDGDNVRKAIMAFQFMYGLATDGNLNPEVLAVLETGAQVIGTYQVTADDEAAVVPAIPSDYAEMAMLTFLGYESVQEAVAERFHMDVDSRCAKPLRHVSRGRHCFHPAHRHEPGRAGSSDRGRQGFAPGEGL